MAKDRLENLLGEEEEEEVEKEIEERQSEEEVGDEERQTVEVSEMVLDSELNSAGKTVESEVEEQETEAQTASFVSTIEEQAIEKARSMISSSRSVSKEETDESEEFVSEAKGSPLSFEEAESEDELQDSDNEEQEVIEVAAKTIVDKHNSDRQPNSVELYSREEDIQQQEDGESAEEGEAPLKEILLVRPEESPVIVVPEMRKSMKGSKPYIELFNKESSPYQLLSRKQRESSRKVQTYEEMTNLGEERREVERQKRLDEMERQRKLALAMSGSSKARQYVRKTDKFRDQEVVEKETMATTGKGEQVNLEGELRKRKADSGMDFKRNERAKSRRRINRCAEVAVDDPRLYRKRIMSTLFDWDET